MEFDYITSIILKNHKEKCIKTFSSKRFHVKQTRFIDKHEKLIINTTKIKIQISNISLLFHI